MLNEHGMQNAKHVVTSAVARNVDDEDEEKRALKSIASFDALWARVSSWLAFATNRLARSLAKPSESDISVSKRLLRYLIGTMHSGLKLQVQNSACSTLTMFTDSDWVGDRPTRKSVSSWVIILDGFSCPAPVLDTVGDCSIIM